MENNIKICSNCVMDTTDKKISFDEKGVCDHCNDFYENVKPNWHTDEKGDQELQKIIDKTTFRVILFPKVVLNKERNNNRFRLLIDYESLAE